MPVSTPQSVSAPVALAPPSARSRLRIGFVLDRFGEPGPGGGFYLGGTELQLLRILRALDPERFEPEIYFLYDLAEHAELAAYPCFTLALDPWRPRRLQLLAALVRLLRRRQPQIVQGMLAEGLLFGVAASALARVPTIVGSRRNAGHGIRRPHRIALRLLRPFVTSWQVNSGTIAQLLCDAEGIHRGRVAVLPNALDLERFAAPTAEEKRLARQALAPETTGPILVTVANLTPVKQHHVALEALALLQDSLTEARLWILGDGPLREELGARAERLGVAEQVRLWGKQEDVRPWLRAADLAVLCSSSEGASNAVLEFLAMGLPAVLSDIPANREIGRGEYFPVGDAAALARAIADLWGNPARQVSLRRQGWDWAAQFSAERVAVQTRAYYQELAAERRPAAS